MRIEHDISLASRTTMNIGGNARMFVTLSSNEDVERLMDLAHAEAKPIFVLGGGSNIIIRDEGFDGVVAHNHILGYEILEETEDDLTLKVGAGETWDELVSYAVERNLSGIEAMAGIPGTVGAAPVQNIGAYGQEIADTLVSIDAYDSSANTFVSLETIDCGFSYRHSIFRGKEAGRYIITAVTVKLYKHAPQPPFYRDVETYFMVNNITTYSHSTVREAVLAIRARKLPDWHSHPNSGSFFKNAIVEKWKYEDLLSQYPDMPSFDMAGGSKKIPTGWLIERAGLKGQQFFNMKVHDGNALVLINANNASYDNLAQARDHIISSVRDMFQIAIEQEPLEL